MSYREVERLEGVGRILRADGSEVTTRRYKLVIRQHMIDVGRGEQLPGLLQIDGRVELDADEGIAFVVTGDQLVLELVDGRRLPFFFTDSSGRIAARGSLQ